MPVTAMDRYITATEAMAGITAPPSSLDALALVLIDRPRVR